MLYFQRLSEETKQFFVDGRNSKLSRKEQKKARKRAAKAARKAAIARNRPVKNMAIIPYGAKKVSRRAVEKKLTQEHQEGNCLRTCARARVRVCAWTLHSVVITADHCSRPAHRVHCSDDARRCPSHGIC